MADRSHVTIRIPTDSLTDEVIDLLTVLESRWQPSGPTNDDDTAVWEFEERAWGMYNDGIAATLFDLTEGNVPFTATDGGHDSWSPSTTGWRPGMDSPRTRQETAEGDPVLTRTEWRTLVDLDSEEFRQRIAAHFEDNPQGWVSPTPDW